MSKEFLSLLKLFNPGDMLKIKKNLPIIQILHPIQTKLLELSNSFKMPNLPFQFLPLRPAPSISFGVQVIPN
jgi:hypothetical protein